MLKRLHPIAGITGFVTILTFWISTIAAEISRSQHTVTQVKQAIPWGLPVLVPALAITGVAGLQMAGRSATPLITAKRRRMPFVAANGLLILTPAAIYLDFLATRTDFGAVFYSVQALELTAGAVNLTLMTLNIRDGLRLSRRFNTRRQRSTLATGPHQAGKERSSDIRD